MKIHRLLIQAWTKSYQNRCNVLQIMTRDLNCRCLRLLSQDFKKMQLERKHFFHTGSWVLMLINTTNIIPVIRNAYYFAILHYFLYNNERSITAFFQLVKGAGSPDGYGFCWHVWIDLGLKKSPPGITFFMFLPLPHTYLIKKLMYFLS